MSQGYALGNILSNHAQSFSDLLNTMSVSHQNRLINHFGKSPRLTPDQLKIEMLNTQCDRMIYDERLDDKTRAHWTAVKASNLLQVGDVYEADRLMYQSFMLDPSNSMVKEIRDQVRKFKTEMNQKGIAQTRGILQDIYTYSPEEISQVESKSARASLIAGEGMALMVQNKWEEGRNKIKEALAFDASNTLARDLAKVAEAKENKALRDTQTSVELARIACYQGDFYQANKYLTEAIPRESNPEHRALLHLYRSQIEHICGQTESKKQDVRAGENLSLLARKGYVATLAEKGEEAGIANFFKTFENSRLIPEYKEHTEIHKGVAANALEVVEEHQRKADELEAKGNRTPKEQLELIKHQAIAAAAGLGYFGAEAAPYIEFALAAYSGTGIVVGATRLGFQVIRTAETALKAYNSLRPRVTSFLKSEKLKVYDTHGNLVLNAKNKPMKVRLLEGEANLIDAKNKPILDSAGKPIRVKTYTWQPEIKNQSGETLTIRRGEVAGKSAFIAENSPHSSKTTDVYQARMSDFIVPETSQKTPLTPTTKSVAPSHTSFSATTSSHISQTSQQEKGIEFSGGQKTVEQSQEKSPAKVSWDTAGIKEEKSLPAIERESIREKTSSVREVVESFPGHAGTLKESHHKDPISSNISRPVEISPPRPTNQVTITLDSKQIRLAEIRKRVDPKFFKDVPEELIRIPEGSKRGDKELMQKYQRNFDQCNLYMKNLRDLRDEGGEKIPFEVLEYFLTMTDSKFKPPTWTQSYILEPSDKGIGFKFIDPKNYKHELRWMVGVDDLKAPACRRVNYVVHEANNKWLSIDGRIITHTSTESSTHMPEENFANQPWEHYDPTYKPPTEEGVRKMNEAQLRKKAGL